MSRILGAGFVALVAATIGLIGWQLAATAPSAPSDPAPTVEVTEPDVPTAADPVAVEPSPSAEPALGAFSGELVDGFDAALPVGPGQGVLQLSGPPEVLVIVETTPSPTEAEIE